MTARQLLDRLTEIRDRGSADPEVNHCDADDALLEFVFAHANGLAQQIGERWDAIDKWYA